MESKGLGLGRLLVGVIVANIAVALLPLGVDSDQKSVTARSQPKAESVELGTFSNRTGRPAKDNVITPIATDKIR